MIERRFGIVSYGIRLSIVLVVLVFCGFGYWIGRVQFRHPGEDAALSGGKVDGVTSSSPTLRMESKGGSRLVVYFFHKTQRCEECDRIESHSSETLEREYSEYLKDGQLAWRAMDFEDDTRSQYREDFGLFASTVVLAEEKDGKTIRYKNLVEPVWEKVGGEKEAFIDFLRSEIETFVSYPGKGED